MDILKSKGLVLIIPRGLKSNVVTSLRRAVKPAAAHNWMLAKSNDAESSRPPAL